MMSGFFSSLSSPSMSLLPRLLTLGPGEPPSLFWAAARAAAWAAIALRRLRLVAHGDHRASMTAIAPTMMAAVTPMMTDLVGVMEKYGSSLSVVGDRFVIIEIPTYIQCWTSYQTNYS